MRTRTRKRRDLESGLAGSDLRSWVRAGLAAVKSSDAKLIAPEHQKKVVQSIDLDTATTAELPKAHRWDYILALHESNQLVGLEVHPARDDEIDVVIKKRRNAKMVLDRELAPGHVIESWTWTANGRTDFSRMESARRRLDQAGIEFQSKPVRFP